MSLESAIKANTDAVNRLADVMAQYLAAAAPTMEGTPAQTPATVEEAPTKDQVIEAVQGLVSSKGRQAAKELLESFGVSKVSELDPANYADVLAKVA